MRIDLQGKVALVGGCTRGIGQAIAKNLALAGASVVLMGRNEADLKASKAALFKAEGANHFIFIADHSNPEAASNALLDLMREKNISLHILVNNTGGPPAESLLKETTNAFEECFRQHLLCNHLFAQAVLPGMISGGYGRIINIISTSVKAPLANLGVSNTIRGAVASWAKTLANETAQWGITVNNVLPGATETVRLENIIRNKALKTGKTEESIRQEMLHEIPAKRFATANEIAYTVCFLASEQAGYITGINVPVDGGRLPCL
jgi:3-oxoacyl-[acyl-carrier protein] reductase